jgi:hypothetical protein
MNMIVLCDTSLIEQGQETNSDHETRIQRRDTHPDHTTSYEADGLRDLLSGTSKLIAFEKLKFDSVLLRQNSPPHSYYTSVRLLGNRQRLPRESKQTNEVAYAQDNSSPRASA